MHDCMRFFKVLSLNVHQKVILRTFVASIRLTDVSDSGLGITVLCLCLILLGDRQTRLSRGINGTT